ncbi:SDR family NAD(P)-dependent oxidoreductase [Actinomadura kijaniata]|uniref:SDR family NAD(P)-dependent oxidoreductase n=1 Tax=Actinomadura kijaniata TaxID=46161 RepID=UPI001C3F1541|nr:SDR family oxidoreductase [Actinomadura kijaniata]
MDMQQEIDDAGGAPRPPNRRAMLAAFGGAAAGAVGLAGTAPAFAAPAPRPDPPGRRFQGKTVLITGGTSGIGEATARAFAAEGARVFFCGRRAGLGQAVQERIRKEGGQATYIQADVRDPRRLRRFVDETARAGGGRIDIAFNNAGIGLPARPIHELDHRDWENVHLTNDRGVYLSIKYEVPHMLRAGGVIICTASWSTRPGGAAYTAGKRAIMGIVEVAALDYGDRGIRVNAIVPGTTDTPFVRPGGLSDAMWEEFKRAWGPLNVNALKRMAEPWEIARAVLALSTDEFGYMTGSAVEVAGGPPRGGPMVMPPGFPGPR